MNATRERTPRGMRTLGWVAVASMLAVALLAPGGATAAEGNPPGVECAGYAYHFKIDTGDLENRTYTAADAPLVVTNWAGQEITISNFNGQTFSWSSTLPVGKVVWKEGSVEPSITYDPPVTSGSITDDTQQGLSHVTFCGGATTTTTTTSDTTTSDTTTSDTTTSDTTTSSTTTVSTTTSTSTSFTQSVGELTDPPVITNPPSDAIGGDRAMTTGSAWRLLLIGLAGLLASLLVLTPARAPRRR